MTNRFSFTLRPTRANGSDFNALDREFTAANRAAGYIFCRAGQITLTLNPKFNSFFTIFTFLLPILK